MSKMSTKDRNNDSLNGGTNNNARQKSNNKRRGSKNPNRPSTRNHVGEDQHYTLANAPDAGNSIDWYNKSPVLLKDAANITMAHPVGLGMSLVMPQGTSGKVGTYSDPGIMALNFIPTIASGSSGTHASDINSATNIAARNIYSFVRHTNSGHANYDAPDLMKYLIAMDSIYMVYAHCARIYGVLRLYDGRNRYYPDQILRALGVANVTPQMGINEFRSALNRIAYKIGVMNVPNNLSYMQRHMWLCSNLYADEPGNTFQTYCFRPGGAYRYRFSTPKDPTGSLEMKVLPTMSLQSWLNTLEELMAPVLSSEDMAIMSGDLLKAYGESSMFKLTTVPEDYQVLPTYNEEVLSQIENATIWYGIDNSVESADKDHHKWDIRENTTQDDANLGALYQNPTLLSPYGCQFDSVINLHTEEVNPENVMIATRLMTTAVSAKWMKTKEKLYTMTAMDYGSEIIVAAFMYTGLGSANIDDLNCYVDIFSDTTPAQAVSETAVSMIAAGYLQTFNRHPLVFVGTRTFKDPASTTTPSEPTIYTPAFMLGVSNMSTVDHRTLESMHNVAMLSMFDVSSNNLNRG
ncbi:capsid protein [Otarine picobirnavirus]|uniref:capsid protein n=1 Tax=Otarine picobirnavirus TaxID=1187973 RepID=UPI00025F3D50|nr:capsid protein [Otarine picobirnavirus]AFJ79070.1 capsid protein [Otarine picobirnavirus]AMP18929.1 capsid protein [Otarine picobirnavirus]